MSQVIHHGPPAPGADPWEEYELSLDREPLATHIRDMRCLVVADRWHTGEGIYGPLLRGGSRLTMAGQIHVEMALESVGAVKVMCLPPLDVLTRRIERRGDNLVSVGQLYSIHLWYEAEATRHGYRVVTGEEHLPQLIQGIMAEAQLRNAIAREVQRFSAGTYVGALYPDALLCGDVRNEGPRARPELTRPFTPLHASGGSRWLFDALFQADLVSRVGIVNTGEPGIDLPHLWRALREPSLVALGLNAERRLAALGLPAVRVFHPQAASRFRHHDREGYALSLKTAAFRMGDTGGDQR